MISPSPGTRAASPSSAPVVISSFSSNDIGSSLEDVLQATPSAPTPNDKVEPAEANVTSDKLQDASEPDKRTLLKTTPVDATPSASSPHVFISETPETMPLVDTPTAAPAEPRSPAVTMPRVSPPLTASVAPSMPKSSTRSRTSSFAASNSPVTRPPFMTNEHVASPQPSPLTHPVPHVSHTPRSVSSFMDGTDHEEVTNPREWTSGGRPVSWMSLGIPRSESRTSVRPRQAPRPRAAASEMREAAARGARYVSHIYCRSCRRDPCIDVTTTMCGHIFCNKYELVFCDVCVRVC
ncbi:hypothetical protein DENSPDRAFT_216909 [Dentipellis sp. KUC8613]|nr:hypothetical protein DENSPDRAFT_216909 [Dentipellis sp. KUC8613]